MKLQERAAIALQSTCFLSETGLDYCQRAHELVPNSRRKRFLGAAGEQVGVHAQGAQDGHAVLRGLGFLLAHHAQHWHQAHVHHAEVAGAHPELELHRHHPNFFSPALHAFKIHLHGYPNKCSKCCSDQAGPRVHQSANTGAL